MRKGSPFVKIDKEKLEMAIKISGGQKTILSKKIGHDPSFLTSYNNPNYDLMRKTDILLIQHETGVDITLVAPVKKEEPKKESNSIVVDDEFFKKLSSAICIGVKNGIIEAQKEDRRIFTEECRKVSNKHFNK